MVERRAPEPPVEQVGYSLQVAVRLLILAALVARLRPAAGVGLRRHVLRREAGDLIYAIARAAEDPARAPIAEQDAPAARHEIDERLDERRVGDDDLGVDRARQPDDLEQVALARQEHGQPARAV